MTAMHNTLTHGSRPPSHLRLRSRRLALIGAAVVLGVSACGADSGSGSSPTSLPAPAVIEVAGAGSAGGASPAGMGVAESDSMDSKMMVPMSVTYEWAGESVDLTSAAASWFFAPGVQPSTEQVQALAAAFGVSGDVVAVAADMGGGWTVGPNDGTAPSVTVATDAMQSWWYSPAWQTDFAPSECVPVALGNDVIEPAGTVAGGTVDAVCEPQPPVGVPSAADAEQAARELLTSLGIDVGQYEFEVYADEWNASVSGFLLLDGVRTNLSVNVGFGENGAVTWAGGFLATPQRGADYPRIGVETAIARLNDQAASWMTGYGSAVTGIATRAEGVAVEATLAPTEITDPPTDPATDPAVTEIPPVDDVLVDPTFDCTDPAVSCVPDQPIDGPIDIEPMVFTLTGVGASLEQVWAADGTVWLLPGYAFTGAEGMIATVLAVEDQYLVQAEPELVGEPMPLPEPMPVETAVPPTDGVGEPGASSTRDPVGVVGLPLDEAVALAELNGWTVRTAREDGVDLAVTADFVDTRLNVAVDNGTVTDVLSVG